MLKFVQAFSLQVALKMMTFKTLMLKILLNASCCLIPTAAYKYVDDLTMLRHSWTFSNMGSSQCFVDMSARLLCGDEIVLSNSLIFKSVKIKPRVRSVGPKICYRLTLANNWLACLVYLFIVVVLIFCSLISTKTKLKVITKLYVFISSV